MSLDKLIVANVRFFQMKWYHLRNYWMLKSKHTC